MFGLAGKKGRERKIPKLRNEFGLSVFVFSFIPLSFQPSKHTLMDKSPILELSFQSWEERFFVGLAFRFLFPSIFFYFLVVVYN
jgi:hypothetical protein